MVFRREGGGREWGPYTCRILAASNTLHVLKCTFLFGMFKLNYVQLVPILKQVLGKLLVPGMSVF